LEELKDMNKKKGNVKKGFLGVGMLAGVVFVVFLMVSLNVGDGITIYTKTFKHVDLDAVGDGTGLGSMVIAFYVYPHAADPGTTYASNLTTGWYATASVNDTHAGSDVPYSTAVDLVWKVQWNVTHAWNGTAFDPTYTRGFLNCSGLSISSGALTQVLIGNNESFVWYHYYINNAAAGYTISKGQNVTSCIGNWEAYF
jgi:hypothetical protein